MSNYSDNNQNSYGHFNGFHHQQPSSGSFEEYSARKRNPNFNFGEANQETKIKVPLPELDFNDPDFLKILKEYEKDEDDYPLTPAEREKELQALRLKAKDKPLFDQGLTYIFMVVCFGLFVLLVNWCNSKELQRLKEEYGFEAKKEVPELWWRKALVYRLHVPTFSDSNGDGIGDLKGVLDNLEYLTYLGVDAVVIRSLMEYSIEEGYIGVSNFTNIDPRFGNFHLLSFLIKAFHEKDIKLIIELVPNHTSRKHVWFQNSRMENHKSKFRNSKLEIPNKYKDYYVWNEGRSSDDGSKIPPNNWLTVDSKQAWTCDNMAETCYYHHFHKTLPDLNYRNLDVQREMMMTFKFWLDKGFDAIYLDHVSPLFESPYVDLDEPFTLKAISSMESMGLSEEEMRKKATYSSYSHAFTVNQPELHDYLGSWNEFVQSYSLKREQRLALLIDVTNSESDSENAGIAKNYFTWTDTSITHSLMNINENCGGVCLHDVVEDSLGKLPEGRDPMWMVGPKEGCPSMPTMYHNIYNALLLLLPGGVLMKSGAEMGDFEDLQNHRSYILPKHKYMYDELVKNLTMSSSATAAFLSQLSSESSVSPSSASLKVIHMLARLRKVEPLVNGDIQYAVVNNDLFSFVRFTRDRVPYLVALNFGQSPATEDYSFSAGVAKGKIVAYVPTHKRVVISESGSSWGDDFGGGSREGGGENQNANRGVTTFAEGSLVDLSKLTLRPGEGVVCMLLLNNQANQNENAKDKNKNSDDGDEITGNNNNNDDDDDDDVDDDDYNHHSIM